MELLMEGDNTLQINYPQFFKYGELRVFHAKSEICKELTTTTTTKNLSTYIYAMASLLLYFLRILHLPLEAKLVILPA